MSGTKLRRPPSLSLSGLDADLLCLVLLAALCFSGALAGVVLLFVYFDGCAVNSALIAVTLGLMVVATATQLLISKDGNLLASGVVCLYAVFVAYVAVSANPDGACNPTLRPAQTDALAVWLGLGVTGLSLMWTALRASDNVTNLWRAPSEGGAGGAGGASLNEVLAGGGARAKPADEQRLEAALLPDEPTKTQQPDAEFGDGADSPAAAEVASVLRANALRAPPPADARGAALFCCTMALISTYFGMVLTNWGSIEGERVGGDDDDATSPEAGRVAMWLNISAQWIMFALYIWTLVAPVVFPDRDFS